MGWRDRAAASTCDHGSIVTLLCSIDSREQWVPSLHQWEVRVVARRYLSVGAKIQGASQPKRGHVGTYNPGHVAANYKYEKTPQVRLGRLGRLSYSSHSSNVVDVSFSQVPQ